MKPAIFRTHLKKYFNVMNHADAPTDDEIDSLSDTVMNTLSREADEKARKLTHTRSHRGGRRGGRRGGTRRRTKRGGNPLLWVIIGIGAAALLLGGGCGRRRGCPECGSARTLSRSVSGWQNPNRRNLWGDGVYCRDCGRPY